MATVVFTRTITAGESSSCYRGPVDEDYDDGSSVETPDDAYCAAVEAPNSRVLGKLGGRPLWIQGDETPTCSCGQRMSFAIQLEDRGGGGINFGDAGVGYGFVCSSFPAQAKFLWQCG